jgi:hypothetical protein
MFIHGLPRPAAPVVTESPSRAFATEAALPLDDVRPLKKTVDKTRITPNTVAIDANRHRGLAKNDLLEIVLESLI